MRNSTRKTRRTEEIWRDVVGYEGFYQVSNLGRVRSLPRIVRMSDGRKYRVSEKIMKGRTNEIYYRVTLSKSGKEHDLLIHRLVLEAFVGSCPPNMQACHNDGDHKNNRLENLRWDTSENSHADKKQHGTTVLGRIGNTYKLTGKTEKIKKLYSSGEYTISQLASRFGVTTGSIYYHLYTKRDLDLRKCKKDKRDTNGA